MVGIQMGPKSRHTAARSGLACLEHLYDAGLMAAKTVPCRRCQTPFSVPVRSRPRDHYCSETCRPKCDYPACSTPVIGLGTRCWVHRNYDVEVVDSAQ